MSTYKHTAEYAELRRLYWRLRDVRAFDQAKRRLLYRRIKVERLRLVEQGCSAEHVRLYCRMMADPRIPSREAALVAYENAVLEYARLESRVRSLAKTSSVPAHVCPSATSSSQQLGEFERPPI